MRRLLLLCLFQAVSVMSAIGVCIAWDESPSGCPHPIPIDGPPEKPAPPDEATGSFGVPKEILQAHVDHVLKFLGTQQKKESPVDLALAMQSSFAFAQDRSEKSRADQENAGALLALGIVAGHSQLGWLAGFRPDQKTRAEMGRQGRRVRLNGRRDLAQHFSVSAAIAAISSEDLSNLIGQFKEQSDAAGGSGFSFADLLADQAGSRLGRLAVRDQTSAAEVQQAVAKKHTTKDYMPTIEGLPEGISSERLSSEYGGINGAGYRRLQQEIQNRLDQCRLFKDSTPPKTPPGP
jgi:hypothetical protein